VLDLLLQGLLLGGSAAAQPGPFQAYLVQQTLEQGMRRTLPAVLAPLLSDGPIVVLVLFVLAGVPGWTLRGLAVGGGLYLVGLAVRAARRRADAAPAGLRQGLLRATLVNLLAPGPYLFWGLVAGPIVLAAARRSGLAALSFVVAFYLAMLATNTAVVVGCGWASAGGERLRRGLRTASVVALAGFGLYAIARGLGATGGELGS
jgi:threonine/homoserine/homoserine lactone efflux protein